MPDYNFLYHNCMEALRLNKKVLQMIASKYPGNPPILENSEKVYGVDRVGLTLVRSHLQCLEFGSIFLSRMFQVNRGLFFTNITLTHGFSPFIVVILFFILFSSSITWLSSSFFLDHVSWYSNSPSCGKTGFLWLICLAI